ncbi:MAG: hypothetical protein WB755_14210 [Terriglobales bacterium]
MKRIGYVVLAEIVLAGVLVSLAGAQSSESLGDYARSVRKEEKKGSAKKYDNDNLPATDKISVVGNAQPETDNGDANAAPTTDGNAAQPGDTSAGATPDAQPGAEKKPEVSDAQKVNDDWKKKIDEQKAKVDLLSREMDVTQREYRLRAAAFYADAGNRLRNQGGWDKEDTQYKQQLAQKQKALDDAKKALADLQEQARKAGVPAKVRE